MHCTHGLLLVLEGLRLLLLVELVAGSVSHWLMRHANELLNLLRWLSLASSAPLVATSTVWVTWIVGAGGTLALLADQGRHHRLATTDLGGRLRYLVDNGILEASVDCLVSLLLLHRRLSHAVIHSCSL